jgi:predicted RND superfamily exporter protein
MTLGVGIDATIHLISAWLSEKNMTLRQLIDTTGRNVMASSTTTIAGFVGFLFTTHLGLKGIGVLACIGIFVFLITSIIFSAFLCGTILKKHK